MSGKTSALTVVALLAWVTSACAAQEAYNLIPADAAGGIAVRGITDLKKKGDQFIADTDMKAPLRVSQAVEWIYDALGIKQGVDEDGSVALVVANPKTAGLSLVNETGTIAFDHLQELVVLAVPFTDLDKIAGNFNFKKGELKPDKMATGEVPRIGKCFFCAHGKHLFVGPNEKAVAGVATGKSLGKGLPADRRQAVQGADILLQIRAGAWGPLWKQFFHAGAAPDFEVELLGKEPADDQKKIFRQLINTLGSVRLVLAALRIDNGVSLRLVNIFPKEGHKAAKEFLKTLQGGAGASDLKGLPNGQVIAAQAIRGDGARNAAVVRMLFNLLVRDVIQPRLLLSSTDRPNFVGVFTEVWTRLKGSRVAIYQNVDRPKHGLLSAVAILDTDDGAKFVDDMKYLARLANRADKDLADRTTREATVAEIDQLIRDLGDRKFRIRESATTKLGLIGEPALPYLDQALQSNDLEVRRRATDIKKRIVAAAVERRKELLSRDVTRHLRPVFAFAPKAETLDGRRVEVVHLILPGKEEASAAQLRQLFGPDWNKIRLAAHGKQVVALLGSDEKLLQAALKNLREDKAGLAESKALTGFARHSDPGHKMEFHLSLQTAVALLKAEDLTHPAKAGRRPGLTSFALAVEPDRLELDIWVPVTEFRALIKEGGW